MINNPKTNSPRAGARISVKYEMRNTPKGVFSAYTNDEMLCMKERNSYAYNGVFVSMIPNGKLIIFDKLNY